MSDRNQMMELSIIAGNDFTGPYLHAGLLQKLGFRGKGSLQGYIDWVKHHGSVENNQNMYKEMVLLVK